MNHRPTAANSTRIATLITTITVSERPISRAPNALIRVSSTTAPTASDVTSTGACALVTKVAA